MLSELAGVMLPSAVALGVLTAVYRGRRRAEPLGGRAAILESAVIVGVFLVAAVEGLSALTAFRAGPLAVVWGVAAVIAWTAAVRARPRPAPETVAPSAGTDAAPTALVRAVLGISAVFVGVSLLVALVAPPNNWDSMTYHMPRVAHWLANGSVRYYPATTTRQLFLPPLNAYAIATIQALAGSDRFANPVQWLAYVVAATAASVVAGRVGGDRAAQALAALAVVTLPMAVLQAPTTQADLVTAAAVLTFVAFVFAAPTPANVVYAGAALGLALLAKPMSAFYAAPFGVLLLVRWAKGTAGAVARRLAGTALAGVGVAALAALIAAGPAIRNTRTFGAPWSAGAEAHRVQNTAPGLVSLASNVARDTVLHVPVPGYGRAVVALHRALGLDPDDPRTTHIYDLRFTEVADAWFRPLVPNENLAGNPVQFVGACALLVWALVRRPRDATARAALTVGVAATVGWMLMQVPLKWQPWSARFDLPFFGILGVPIGVALARLPARLVAAAAVALVAGALPALLIAKHRPLAPLPPLPGLPASFPRTSILVADRAELRFRGGPPIRGAYTQAVARIRASGCDVVGLELRRDDWEYPLWSLLDAAAGSGPRIEAVAVENESATLPPEGPEPCAVVSSRAPSRFDEVPGWSREVLGEKPLVALYLRR